MCLKRTVVLHGFSADPKWQAAFLHLKSQGLTVGFEVDVSLDVNGVPYVCGAENEFVCTLPQLFEGVVLQSGAPIVIDLLHRRGWANVVNLIELNSCVNAIIPLESQILSYFGDPRTKDQPGRSGIPLNHFGIVLSGDNIAMPPEHRSLFSSVFWQPEPGTSTALTEVCDSCDHIFYILPFRAPNCRLEHKGKQWEPMELSLHDIALCMKSGKVPILIGDHQELISLLDELT